MYVICCYLTVANAATKVGEQTTRRTMDPDGALISEHKGEESMLSERSDSLFLLVMPLIWRCTQRLTKRMTNSSKLVILRVVTRRTPLSILASSSNRYCHRVEMILMMVHHVGISAA